MKIEFIKSFTKKATMLVASAALAVAVVPATALADTVVNSTTGPDNVVVVKWTAAGTTKTANVDLDTLAYETTTLGAQFYKTGWNVVKSDKYVKLSTILNAAQSGSYKASSAWNSSKKLTFKVWNQDKATKEWSVDNYTKFTEFTYANLLAGTGFYGNATPTILGSVTNSTMYTEPVLALQSTSVAEDSSVSYLATAQDVLDSSNVTTNTATSPRLMWGYMDQNHEGGNRFPSNVDEITISSIS